MADPIPRAQAKKKEQRGPRGQSSCLGSEVKDKERWSGRRGSIEKESVSL